MAQRGVIVNKLIVVKSDHYYGGIVRPRQHLTPNKKAR